MSGRDRALAGRTGTVVLAFVVLLLGAASGMVMGQRTNAEANQRFDLAVDEAVTAIQLQLQKIEVRAASLPALRELAPDLDAWDRLISATSVENDLPGIVNLASYEVLRAPSEDDVDGLRARLAASVGDDVALRLSDEDVSVVIDRVSPIEINRPALGFDVTLNPSAAIAIRRAMQTGQPSISDATPLVQTPERGPGFILYTPPLELESGAEAMGGVVVDGQSFLDALEPLLGRVSLHVVDGTETGPLTLAISEGHDRGARLTTVREVDANGNSWRVEFASLQGPTTAETLSGPLIGIGVTLVLGLFATVALQALRSRQDAEESVRRRTAELTEANTALRAALRAKDDFVGVVSHELRTPLTVIRGFVSTLRDGARLDAAGRDLALDRIDRNAVRLHALVEDLLATARLQAGAERARRAVVDVGALLHEVVADVDPGVELDAVGGLRADVDPTHLRRIIENLLSNARAYGKAPITARAFPDNGSVIVEVRDHGAGVPPELRRQVFERFEQLQTGTTREARGAGLGLAIVRGLCELNSATVTLTDADPGACFRIGLEAAPEQAVAGASQPNAARDPGTEPSNDRERRPVA